MIRKQRLIGMVGMVVCCGLLFGNSVLADTGKYQDVPDGYVYKKYIEELSAQKLVEGTADGQFSPDSPLTREQFAKLVVMVFGLPTVDGGIPFQDCTEAWSMPYILSAYKAGIIQGTSEESFSPKQYVRKQEAAVMLSRLFPTDAVQKNEQDWAGGALTLIRNEVLPVPLQSMLVDVQAPLSRGEAAALLSLTLQAREQGSSSAKPKPMPFPGQAVSYHKDNWFSLELKQEQYVQLQMNHGIIVDIQSPNGSPVPVQKGNSAVFKAKDAGRYVVHVTDLQPGAILTGSNGSLQEHALSLDPAHTKEVTVNVNAGETLFVQAELKKHKTYELKAHGENQAVFDMEMLNSEGIVLNQGHVSTMQVTTESDGIFYGKVRPDRQGGAITLSLLEVGLDMEHPINLRVGHSDQISPNEGSLYYKAAASPDNPLMVQAKGAVSYQLVKVSNEWVPPKESIGYYLDSYGGLTKDVPVPGHYVTNIDSSTSTLNGEPYTLNCTCVVKLSAPASSNLSLNVMDGSSKENAYAIEWVRREWKTGYKSNSVVGVFYQLTLEKGKDYTFVLNEQLTELSKKQLKLKEKISWTQEELKETMFVHPPQTIADAVIPADAKRKMTVFGPDGKEVLVDEKLTGTISFKAASTGIYVVELQSDVQGYATEIRINNAD